MNEYTYAVETHLSGAKEVAMRARKMEREQAQRNAEFIIDSAPSTKASTTHKRSPLQWIVLLFTSPRLS